MINQLLLVCFDWLPMADSDVSWRMKYFFFMLWWRRVSIRFIHGDALFQKKKFDLKPEIGHWNLGVAFTNADFVENKHNFHVLITSNCSLQQTLWCSCRKFALNWDINGQTANLSLLKRLTCPHKRPQFYKWWNLN